jgi:phage terminase large subunit
MNLFKKTAKQIEAVKLLASAAIYILLFGGSRSGKTFILLYAIIVRAVKAPGSRHAVIRLHFNAVKQSIRLVHHIAERIRNLAAWSG